MTEEHLGRIFIYWRAKKMEFYRITSKENNIIKLISQLQKSSSKRRELGLFVLEGLRICSDAVKNNYDIEMLIISETANEKYSENIEEISYKSKKNFVLPDALFKKISDTVNPQGVLCICKISSYSPEEINPEGKYIALENLQDPSNLGAISRTAEALGIDGIIIQGGCDPYSPKSLRASMGALVRIPVFQTDNLFDIFETCGLRSFASVVHTKAESLGQVKFDKGCVVLIGNEANGLTDNAIQMSDVLLTIPMRGNAESLNAAVAASLIMWEMSK